MAIEIRLLEANDRAEIEVVSLLEEMQAHYAVHCPPRDEILSGLRARPPGSELLVALSGVNLVGLCSFSAIYPGPGLSPGIFLKELYVSRIARSQGIGRSLMRGLAGLARQRGLSRIDWTADPSDARLLAFYDELGGKPKTDKLFYRLDGEALDLLGQEPA